MAEAAARKPHAVLAAAAAIAAEREGEKVALRRRVDAAGRRAGGGPPFTVTLLVRAAAIVAVFHVVDQCRRAAARGIARGAAVACDAAAAADTALAWGAADAGTRDHDRAAAAAVARSSTFRLRSRVTAARRLACLADHRLRPTLTGGGRRARARF